MMLVVILVALCVFLIYRYTTRNHDYWAKRNVKHDRPLPFFGNHLKNVLLKRTQSDIGTEMLNKYKAEKIVGYYEGTSPKLIIKDPEILRQIMSVDFDFFADRGLNYISKNDTLLNNVTFACGDQWKSMREEIICAFTPNKLKKMLPQIQECVKNLQIAVKRISLHEKIVTAYDLSVEYTMQTIAACGFGIHLNTNSDQSLLVDLAKEFFVKPNWQAFLVALVETFPELAYLFNIKLIDTQLEKLLMKMTKNIQAEKQLNPGGFKDFLDTASEMASKRVDNRSELSETEKELEKLKFTTSQVFMFFFGGFESTATLMSTSLHYLAHNPEIQVQIQKEIDLVLSKHDNKLINCLDEMTLLDMAFQETMRLLPPFGSTKRVCVKKYTLPGTNVTIDPGVRILIPIQSIHMDPEIYEKPEEFRPERFASALGKIADFKYLPFGEGPRKCIGKKVALMVASAGVASILHQFTVVPAMSSKPQISFKKNAFLIQAVEGGIPVKFVPRGRLD